MTAYAGLIVGLGNPGPAYEKTRHNVGFMLVDTVLEQIADTDYRTATRLPVQSGDWELWQIDLPRIPRSRGHFLLLKPLTYMNLSGKAVLPVIKQHAITPANILVAHDEMDLPPGRAKLKKGGGDAGHNGIKSIAEELGTPEFMRLRIGVGRPVQQNVRDWVLEPFGQADREAISATLIDCRDTLPLVFSPKGGLSQAQQRLHPLDHTPAPSE